MGAGKDIYGPYGLATWSVRLNHDAHEGRSVWESCPIKKGTVVFLSVQNLPPMLCTIGQSANRIEAANAAPPGAKSNGLFGYVNRSITRVGNYPGGKTPLTVGCELHVIPSWQIQEITTAAAIPPPVNGSLDGVDVRPLQGYEVDRIQVWAAVDSATPDLIQPRLWLRHPSGVWSESAPNPAGGPAPVVRSRVYDVSIRQADRIALSFDFSGVPSGQPVTVSYGLLTAPEPGAERQFHIRFAAVPAPYK